QIYLAVPVAIYGTLWAFILAFTIRYLPYGMRYAASGILQIHPELEEAAAIAGSPLRTALRRIVVPLATPALLAGWLFIFLMPAPDRRRAVILASPRAQPVSVAMFDLWANGQGTELAAFGLVWTAIMTVIAAGFYLVGRRTIPFAVRGVLENGTWTWKHRRKKSKRSPSRATPCWSAPTTGRAAGRGASCVISSNTNFRSRCIWSTRDVPKSAATAVIPISSRCRSRPTTSSCWCRRRACRRCCAAAPLPARAAPRCFLRVLARPTTPKPRRSAASSRQSSPRPGLPCPAPIAWAISAQKLAWS